MAKTSDKDLKCKVKMGILTCTLGAPGGRSLRYTAPAMAASPVPITVFTSSYCSWCKPAFEKVTKTTQSFKDMVSINVVNVDNNKDDENVTILPTVKVGKNNYLKGPNFDEDQLVTMIFNNLNESAYPGERNGRQAEREL